MLREEREGDRSSRSSFTPSDLGVSERMKPPPAPSPRVVVIAMKLSVSGDCWTLNLTLLLCCVKVEGRRPRGFGFSAGSGL